MGKGRRSEIVVDGDTARVELTQGQWAIIDAADVSLVEGRAWHASNPSQHLWYACADDALGRDLMHRVILQPRPGFVTDHIDGDGLNNRRSNLREATHRQNMCNRRPTRGALPKGVFYGPGPCFTAKIAVDARPVRIGVYDTIEEAQAAYNARARELFGEFARPDERSGFREDPERVRRFAGRALVLKPGEDAFGRIAKCYRHDCDDWDSPPADCPNCLVLPASADRTRLEVAQFERRWREAQREEWRRADEAWERDRQQRETAHAD